MNTPLTARDKAQQDAFEAIKKNNFNAIVLATVGFGKGRLISLVIQKLFLRGNKTFLYTCDNQRLRDVDFPNEMAKWLPKDLLSKITIDYKCYQTTRTWVNKNYDCLIADEFDASISPEYSKLYFNNNFKHKVLLSGTLSTEKKKIAVEIAPIVYTFNTLRAESEGVINKSDYYIFNYKMSESESREYNKWTQALMVALNNGSKQETVNFLAGKRRDVLTMLNSGVLATQRVARWLRNNDENTRLVIFCERTFQADRVCDHSYHGGNEKNDNLQKFQNGEISSISVVSKIKRGINLQNANAAIFESLTSSSTEFEQRNGRMKRLKTDEIAKVIFMLPWFQTESGEWKPTVVNKYIEKATVNIKAELKHLKL